MYSNVLPKSELNLYACKFAFKHAKKEIEIRNLDFKYLFSCFETNRQLNLHISPFHLSQKKVL